MTVISSLAERSRAPLASKEPADGGSEASCVAWVQGAFRGDRGHGALND